MRRPIVVSWLKYSLAFAVLIFALAVGALAWFAQHPIAFRAGAPVEVHVEKGDTLRMATRRVVEAGAEVPGWALTLLARATGRSAQIKAGSYELSVGITPWELLQKLTRGDVVLSEVKLIEGWNFRQVRAALATSTVLRQDSAALSEREILARLGIARESAEGLFFPDTYLVSRNSSDLDLLRRAHRRMQEVLLAAWSARRPGLPLADPYEALILASIVEKETGRESDRERVAAVFVNRLGRGMLLQTDPTVIYGLGENFDGNLKRAHLERDGPYNTYTRPGLPPTPIAMPGENSIRAALAPAETQDLYFVARGDGSSEFSRTLDQHNNAVNRYQRRR